MLLLQAAKDKSKTNVLSLRCVNVTFPYLLITNSAMRVNLLVAIAYAFHWPVITPPVGPLTIRNPIILSQGKGGGLVTTGRLCRRRTTSLLMSQTAVHPR